MIYFGLNENDKTKIEHIVLILSYDEYTPDDFLSTEDYTIIYTTESKFKIANWLADFDLELGIDFIIEEEKEALKFLFSKDV